MSPFNPPHHTNAASVFEAELDGQTLCTTEHLQALIDNYVKQPDVGQGGFYEKLA